MKFNDNQFGRSMLEMLAVLAVVGVLSIGGIAGFSKAMFQHKINKQAEQFSYILARTWENFESLKSYNGAWNVCPLFIALEIIPSEMIKKGDNSHVYDIFGNKVTLEYSSSGKYMEIGVDIKDKGFSICKNLYEIAKAYREFIGNAQIYRSTNNKINVYGYRRCPANREQNDLCLEDITVAKISEVCGLCKTDDDTKCGFWFVFSLL